MGKKKSDRDKGVGKIKKKAVLVEDDHIGTMMNHFEEKSGSFALLGDDENLQEDASFNGKKFNSVFSVLDDDDDQEGGINEKDGVVIDPNLEELEEEEETMMNHFEEKSGSFALLGDDENLQEDASFNGKKFNSVFSVLDDDDDQEGGINEKDGVVIDPNLEELEEEEEEEEENPSTIKFSGKKKPSKKKSVNDLSKNKKNKGQEEDDLDKILAQLGEISSSQLPQEDKAIVLDNKAGAADDVIVESAAAKKKRKKKEKEKEKKAMAAREGPVEPNTTKLAAKNKKVPKHVREIQERLAKDKEAEEIKEREKEEKRKEDEKERLRQEEAERIAQEKKQVKRERAKQLRIKKREEGRPVTAKQKAEVERLESMRNQYLSSTRNPKTLEQMSSNPPLKKPKYVTRKSVKPRSSNQADDIDANKVDDDDDVEMENVVVENKEVLEVEENGSNSEEDDDDEEWDAKSWDDAELRLPGLSAFADEEEEEVTEREPEPVAQKAIKKKESQPSDAYKPKQRQQEGEAVMVKDDKKIAEEVEGDEKTPRSPICCIMGHVDTGKTKLLDCIRRTNVQEGEAGGITQQIGATYIPAHNIRERTKELKADAKLNVPGLLVIDTPGHEAFKNLRSRGSGLCDIAILVVDIMHGLEQQTIESLHLLRMRNTEFIVALNKVDRLYGWKTCRNAPIGKALKLQNKDVQLEFHHRVTQIITQFKEQGLNTELYNKNKDMGETYSIVPTSAISGEGIPEMLLLLVQWAQKTMVEKLTYINDIQCTVLEVKVVEGLGTTIDVVLVNGVLHEGHEIVVCGFQGPIHTTIRSLLTPHPMKELRVKGAYIHHKEIKAAQGIKVTAQNLEHAVAGTALHVVRPSDDLDDIKESVMADMRNVMNRIDKSGEGVYVQASTLGSLEALLEFLKTPTVNIPVSGIGIGPVHKKDVMKASAMLDKKKEFATILAFDVKVTPEAREIADGLDIKIFTADIIYHLFDQFKAYIGNIKEEKKKEAAEDAVFPCVLQIMPLCVFNKKDPIVLGVNVLEGIVKIGTPICIPQRDFINIGRISSIEKNKQQFDSAKKGEQVAIKLIGSNPEEKQKMFGRHFEIDDELVSHISRESINILKTNYRDELSNEDWKLVVKLKHVFKIQ